MPSPETTAPLVAAAHYEILILRRPPGGTQQVAVHLSGYVPIDSLICDAECVLVSAGLMKERE